MDHLIKGEKIIKELNPSRGGFFWGYVVAFIFLGTIIIPLAIILFIEIGVKANKYYVTNKRVIHEYKFLSRRLTSAQKKNITDVTLKQGVIDRMFGIGTLEINTAGSGNKEIIFKHISNPSKIKAKIHS